MSSKENLYLAILGLRPNSSADEIKNAYHRLALRYHPDKNRSSDAASKFRRIKEAYEYLLAKAMNGNDTPPPPKQPDNSRFQLPQDPPILHSLGLSQSELVKGSRKIVPITRRLYDEKGNLLKTEIKELKIKIQPNALVGSQIVFHFEGDVHPGRIPADIVFVIEHQLYCTVYKKEKTFLDRVGKKVNCFFN